MDKVLKELTDTLTAWKNARTWGAIEIEVQNGEVTLIRKETKQKFTSNYGGLKNEPARFETR